ncbi:DMP19 family protein [Persicobacter psychrovividus]|uniref:DNA mimic protein DMP19 C-terminal domain-containing protein n=1 Tax=Persicobacter psychrovividus TaxID=387638 RepID=A0ABN6LBR5_9BACT|nr:hypothetical protein PEPS_13930 [Persicobacter psychrovividus]
MKRDLRKINEIVAKQDIGSLFNLHDNVDFSIALYEILVNRYDNDPESLNTEELNLLLCMHIENAGQADSILSFLQEWFPQYKERVIKALKEIGAVNSSKIVNRVNALLPKDESWFYDSSDQDSEILMSRLDNEFSDYPDGSMRELYRSYAENNRDKIKK